MKEFPQPLEYFSDANRKHSLSGEYEQQDEEFALIFLYNYYINLRKKDISRIFTKYNKNLIVTCNKLDRLPKAIKGRRPVDVIWDTKNVSLLQEVIIFSQF